MLAPIYLQDYKSRSEQTKILYSVVAALPNEAKAFTWNFISSTILNEITPTIEVYYDFKDTDFQEEITFEDKLMGTVQIGKKVYDAEEIMKFEYNKDLLEMKLTITILHNEKICGKCLSWNIFINDNIVSLPWFPRQNSCDPYPQQILLTDYGVSHRPNISLNFSKDKDDSDIMHVTVKKTLCPISGITIQNVSSNANLTLAFKYLTQPNGLFYSKIEYAKPAPKDDISNGVRTLLEFSIFISFKENIAARDADWSYDNETKTLTVTNTKRQYSEYNFHVDKSVTVDISNLRKTNGKLPPVNITNPSS